jgi:RimJ/RimL family protein N-acetyltransferase
VPANLRSLAVMARLGMRLDDPRGFEHPELPVGHPLRRHLLHRQDRTQTLAEP